MKRPLVREVSQGERRGPGVKKTSLAYIKVKPVMELPFLWNCKILVYDENMARQSSVVLLGPIENIGGKMTKNDHFRSIFSKVLVSYCPNLPKS